MRFRRPPAEEIVSPPVTVLPLFPLPGEPGREMDALSLRVQRDGKGTIVHLDSSGQSTAPSWTSSYLLDASALEKSVEALKLEWEPVAEGFTGRVGVEGSDDLEHWSRITSDAVVASLHYGEHSLVRDKISLKPTARKYLRISWPFALHRVKLLKVEAELVEPAAEQPRSRVPVSTVSKQDQPGEYLFTSPGAIPVDRVRVVLPQKNTLVSVEVLSREDEKSPWRSRASGLVYNLRLEGADVVSSDLELSPATDRHWMLRVRQNGGGLGQGLPVLELGWIPQSLLFVARGEGPFLIAYGNAGRRSVNHRVDDLLARFSNSRREQTVFPRATVGSQIVLGGEGKLKTSPVDLRKSLLWGVLVLAVLVLAWMALHLFRQISRREGEEP